MFGVELPARLGMSCLAEGDTCPLVPIRPRRFVEGVCFAGGTRSTPPASEDVANHRAWNGHRLGLDGDLPPESGQQPEDAFAVDDDQDSTLPKLYEEREPATDHVEVLGSAGHLVRADRIGEFPASHRQVSAESHISTWRERERERDRAAMVFGLRGDGTKVGGPRHCAVLWGRSSSP
jgi:hypothetical protein